MKRVSASTTLIFILVGLNQALGQSLGSIPTNVSHNPTTNTLTLNPTSGPNPQLFIHGVGSINTTEQISTSIQASQSFKFTARIVRQQLYRFGFDLTSSFNILHLNPTGIKKDSLELTSLMFPESSNTGLMITPIAHWVLIGDRNTNALHRLSSEFSFSFRQNKVEDVYQKKLDGTIISGPETIKFKAINVNLMPFKYNFNFQPNGDTNFDLNMGAYWNYFNITNEDVKNFNKLFPFEDPLFTDNSSRIESIGFKFSVGLNGFLFFSDIRFNYNTSSLRDENPFKGTVFNAGIAQNISILEL